MSEHSTDLVLGTAGHIDHGKSTLVQALTGTDPDRLAEEKERGITIELGFARLPLPDGTTLGVVDVPGHERFVRQMIAGATGIDMALLCIAADDGIMPQTLEHLSVLELLNIPTCVVALTKCDLVDAEWVSFVADEVRARLAATPYADAAIVPVSARTGQGLDQLKDALMKAAHATTRRKLGTTLRLPVDRVFTIKGAGTVITGTLWSGSAGVGDEVQILPEGTLTRIRSVQVHGQPLERAQAGHRTALNLNAVSTADVRPGDFLVAPGTVSATDRFDADLTYLGIPGSTKPLESGARVHVAHGTREVVGRVLFMEGTQSLAPGQHAYAQIRLDEPLPVVWGDRFVIRSYSPVYVVGGGMVLRAHPRRSTRMDDDTRALLDALRANDANAACKAAFALKELPVTATELADAAGASVHDAEQALAQLEAQHRAECLPHTANRADRFATKQTMQRARSAIEKALLNFHAQNPQAAGIAKDALRQASLHRADAETFDAVLADAVAHGKAVIDGGEVSHPTAGAGARKLDEQAAQHLGDALAQAGQTPPTIADLIAQSGIDQSRAYRALGALEKAGAATKVNKEYYFSSDALSALEQACRSRLASGAASAAELRDAMGTSRKYAIPLLEYFDGKGITRREGDLRTLA